MPSPVHDYHTIKAQNAVANLAETRAGTLDLLIDNGAMVDVSLDSAEQEVLRCLPPGARLPLITCNLERMVSPLDRQGQSVSGLRIIATLQSPTLEGLPELVRYAGRTGVRQIVLRFAHPRERYVPGLR